MQKAFIVNPGLTVGPTAGDAKAGEGQYFTISVQNKSVACNLPFLKVILNFREPTELNTAVNRLSSNGLDLSKQEIRSSIEQCIEEGFIVSTDQAAEGLVWHANGWGDAWNFHQATRDQKFYDEAPETAWDNKETLLQKYTHSDTAPNAYLNLSHLPLIKLPDPEKITGNFYDTITTRRTTRNFLSQPVKLSDLSSIFHSAVTPMKATRQEAEQLLEEHSSMHLHSWLTFAEICIYAHNCEGIEQGLYYYDLKNHGLRLSNRGDFSAVINQASWKQGVAGASLVVFIMADLGRYMWKYRNPRHYKAVWVQTASLAHRLILSAEAFKYGAFQSPAMHDATVISLFNTTVDRLMPIYLLGLGPCGKR